MPLAFTERRRPRRFRILHMSMQAFLQRFVLRRQQDATGAPPVADRSGQTPTPSGERTLTWKCGVARLDEQYEGLFKLIKQFQGLIKAGGGTETLAASLATLASYVEGHLALEEMYLEHVGFPGLAEHRSGHRAFQHQLQAFQSRLEAGDHSAGLELSQLLYAWIRVHVLKEDPIWSAHAKSRRRH